MNRKWLNECVEFVRRGIVTQEPPDWQSIILDFENGTISGGSREAWHQVRFDAEKLSGIPARARVDCARLSEILRVLKAEEIEMRIEENFLVITAGSTHFSLPILDGPAGINLEVSSESTKVTCNGRDWLAAWNSVAWAAKPNAANLVLSCVAAYLEKTNSGTQLFLVSTDSRRLAVCGLEAQGKMPKDEKSAVGLLLAKRFNNLGSFLEPDDTVEFVFSKAAILSAIVRQDGTIFSINCPTPTGRFPAWREVVPKDSPAISATFAAEELASGIRAATATADNETRRLEIQFDGAKSESVLSCRGIGTSRIRLPFETKKSGSMDISLNADYAAESIKPLMGGQVEVNAWARERPLKLVANMGNYPRWVLLMPLA